MASRLLFTDQIVQITEFKRHAKAYADVARQRPITIAQGSTADLTLASREMVGRVLRAREHLGGVMELLQNQLSGSSIQALAWADKLGDEDLRTFVNQYTESLQNALGSDSDAAWEAVEELLEDWQATAEALDNAELHDALDRRRGARKS